MQDRVIEAIIGAGVLLLVMVGLWTRVEETQSTPQPSDTLKAVIASQPTATERILTAIRLDPGGWTARCRYSTCYHFTYRDGTDVWVANQDYALAVTAPDTGEIFGAKCADCAGDRIRIWRAYQEWSEQRIMRK